MKKLILIALPLALACFAAQGFGQEPVIKQGVYIYDGAIPLAVDRHSAPEVVDWNNDGKKDLLVGQFGSGHVTYFENVGSDLNPVFSGGVKLKDGAGLMSASSG